MWELDHKKSWVQKNWCFQLWSWRILLRVPWTARRSNQSILKEITPWIFIGRTDAEAETPILWSSDAKSQCIWKDPDVRKDWAQEEKRATEDVMVGWHQQLDGQEFEQAQGSLASCSSWGHGESDMTWRLNNTWPGWWVRGKSCSLRLILIKNDVPLNIRHLSRHCRNNKIK